MRRNLYSQHATKRWKAATNWRALWLLLAALGAVAALWWYLDPTPSGEGSAAAVIIVREGEGWTEATQRLRDAGVVRRPVVFKGFVLLSGARAGLLPGRYSIKPGTSTRDVIAALTDPDNQATITVPEGWRIEQTGERLMAHGLATADQWRAAVRSRPDSPLLTTLPEGATLEGYVYPGSYHLTDLNAAAQLVEQAILNLEDHVSPQIRAGVEAQGLTFHEGLTLASIVEREAQLPAERPVIASVFLNRLKLGMPLQTDPTAQYAVGVPGEWWTTNLTRTDLRTDSPYNSYRYKGLPPGPIAGPGVAAIQAVAQPADTEYLYFVARGDGGHAFAKTLEEHNLNVRRYLGR